MATGCSLTGSDSETLSPTGTGLYPELATYPDIPVVGNVQYGVASDGTALMLDVCLPATEVDTDDTTTANDDAIALKPRAAIVSVHGGSWARGDKSNVNWRSVCQWLASEGYVAVSVNYRLAPASIFPSAITDIRKAVRWLRDADVVEKYSINPDLIGAFGGSAGGNLVSLLGTEGTGDLDRGSRVAAVAELSGPTDLTENGRKLGTLSADFEQVQLQYLGCGTLDDCPRALTASPLYDVDDTDPPFFVGHSLDERIPIEQSEAFVEELRGAGIDTTFVTVDGTLHSIAMLNAEMRDRVADFFAAELVTEVPGVVP
jgi:acetyl esterase